MKLRLRLGRKFLVLYAAVLVTAVGIAVTQQYRTTRALLYQGAENTARAVTDVVGALLLESAGLRGGEVLDRSIARFVRELADVSSVVVADSAFVIVSSSAGRDSGGPLSIGPQERAILRAGDRVGIYFERDGRRYFGAYKSVEGPAGARDHRRIRAVVGTEMDVSRLTTRIWLATAGAAATEIAMLVPVLLLLYALTNLLVIRPIGRLSEAVDTFASTGKPMHVEQRSGDELEALADAFSDMTVQRAQSEAVLRHATEAAESASRSKSEFLASMSHELRTPFNAVLGFTGLLLKTPLDRTQREYVEIARAAAEDLLRVISDVLDFSKIEAGRIDLEVASFDVEALAQRVTRVAIQQAAAKDVAMVLRVVPGTPRWARGDETRVRQVLTNLVQNAVKFTAKGQVMVTLDGRPAGERVHYRFAVEDTGIGIPADKLPLLFQRFSQVDSSTTRRFGGSGLGLAISRQLVELMGGRIGVESRPGAGSTFWFELDLPAGEATEEPAPGGTGDVRGVRVLVVDDLEVNRRVEVETLRSFGMDVTAARSGVEALGALESARAAGAPFRLALIDHAMPGMSGVELGREIRRRPELADTLLVLVSSVATSFAGEETRDFAATLLRPLRPSELLEALTALLTGGTPRVRVDDMDAAPYPRLDARVLLVEDNLMNQRVGIEILRRLGCRVDAASDGAEAIRMLASTRYDIVFMDCQMPEMDGFETTRAIREREGADGHTPIVALTAHALTGDRERCLAAGMDDYISKPTRTGDLVAMLRKYVPSVDVAAPAEPAGQPAPEPPQPAGRALAETLLLELIEIFRESGPADVQRIRDALAAGDARGVHLAAHRLKGSLVQVGAMIETAEVKSAIDSATKLAVQLERIGRTGQLSDDAEALVSSLDARVHHVLMQSPRTSRPG